MKSKQACTQASMEDSKQPMKAQEIPIKGGVTLGNDSCNLSRNSVSPLTFARQAAGMVLHCAMILATCFATATAEDSRKSTARFNWLMSTNRCETSCTNRYKGCYNGQCLKKKKTLRQRTKKARNVRCGVCYTCQFLVQLRTKRCLVQHRLQAQESCYKTEIRQQR